MFESDEEVYYKPFKIANAFIENYIEYDSNGEKDNMLSIEDYLDKIRQYLSDMINDHKTQRKWKIQLTMAINLSLLKILTKLLL